MLPVCDVALLSNVLHLHTESDGNAILGALHRATRRAIVIRDVALDDTRRGPIVALAFALATAILGDGEVHTSTHTRNRLGSLGVSEVTLERPGGAEWVLATGRIQ